MTSARDSESTIVPTNEPAVAVPQDSGSNALPIGTAVHEFRIVALIGQGGFGIVYLARDESLDRMVALKEYMPSELAEREGTTTVKIRSQRHAETFEAGLRSFINEARLLAQFDHPSLVKVHRFFTANATAYMVMPYYKGITLKHALRNLDEQPGETWIKALLSQLLDALEIIHSHSCYHRDISPDNILMLEDGRPLLLDFGAARRVIGDRTRAFTVILKPGYAPIEQYAEDPEMKQGPWTDLYALASVLYLALTRKAPPPSIARVVNDRLVPLSRSLNGKYDDAFLRGLDAAMSVKPQDRPQSVAAFRRMLDPGDFPAALGAWAGSRHAAADSLPRTEPPHPFAEDAELQVEIIPTARPAEYTESTSVSPVADRSALAAHASGVVQRLREALTHVGLAVAAMLALATLIVLGISIHSATKDSAPQAAADTPVDPAPAPRPDSSASSSAAILSDRAPPAQAVTEPTPKVEQPIAKRSVADPFKGARATTEARVTTGSAAPGAEPKPRVDAKAPSVAASTPAPQAVVPSPPSVPTPASSRAAAGSRPEPPRQGAALPEARVEPLAKLAPAETTPKPPPVQIAKPSEAAVPLPQAPASQQKREADTDHKNASAPVNVVTAQPPAASVMPNRGGPLPVHKSALGNYVGSFQAPVGSVTHTVGLAITITGDDGGTLTGVAKNYSYNCAGDYFFRGTLKGNELVLRSPTRAGRLGDCGFGFRGTLDGNKIEGKLGNLDVSLYKR
ncbi:MAG: protein kinase domain-containing protein [Burkholderiales bacterium]